EQRRAAVQAEPDHGPRVKQLSDKIRRAGPRLQQRLPRHAGNDGGGQYYPVGGHRPSPAASGLRWISRTVPCGLPFADRKVRPTYSPSTPRIIDCTPDTSSSTTMVDAQPDGVWRTNSASDIVAMAPIPPATDIAMPA